MYFKNKIATIGRVRCKRITHSPFTSALRVLCPDAEFVFLPPLCGIYLFARFARGPVSFRILFCRDLNCTRFDGPVKPSGRLHFEAMRPFLTVFVGRKQYVLRRSLCALPGLLMSIATGMAARLYKAEDTSSQRTHTRDHRLPRPSRYVIHRLDIFKTTVRWLG